MKRTAAPSQNHSFLFVVSIPMSAPIPAGTLVGVPVGAPDDETVMSGKSTKPSTAFCASAAPLRTPQIVVSPRFELT